MGICSLTPLRTSMGPLHWPWPMTLLKKCLRAYKRFWKYFRVRIKYFNKNSPFNKSHFHHEKRWSVVSVNMYLSCNHCCCSIIDWSNLINHWSTLNLLVGVALSVLRYYKFYVLFPIVKCKTQRNKLNEVSWVSCQSVRLKKYHLHLRALFYRYVHQ